MSFHRLHRRLRRRNGLNGRFFRADPAGQSLFHAARLYANIFVCIGLHDILPKHSVRVNGAGHGISLDYLLD